MLHKDPKEPLEFKCFDDAPTNNGWGETDYNPPRPGNWDEEEIEEDGWDDFSNDDYSIPDDL